MKRLAVCRPTGDRSRQTVASSFPPGFSLMEVLLATAILLGSVIVIGELIGIGRRHAESARELAKAQLLCQSKMNELLAGAASLEGVDAELLEEPETEQPIPETSSADSESPESAAPPGALAWWYSVEVLDAAHPALAAVRVTVWKAQDEESKRRYVYSMVRWMPASRSGEGFSTDNMVFGGL
ncbi:MAG: hypothetical protein GXP27_14220 [Planctomycetes bacterium]|nr:hypothetical protein [Planctomycetota bacterium]